jgi:predicted ATPase
LVVGEPGIGKSRLIEEFRATLGETPHTFVEISSSQLLQNTPLHPLAEWGRQRSGGTATPAERLADLENTLRLVGLDPSEYAPLIAPLVDVPLPEGRAVNLAPEELGRRQLAALVTWVLAWARSQAVVIAFEDLHWADPTTLDLIGALAARGYQAPLFIVATARPEFRPPWSFRPHHSVIALAPLDPAQVQKMVREISAGRALSSEVVDGVSERTGGVPLFVEEVTRLLLERGEAGGLHAIPPTLQQLLTARLDRLGKAREVAQIGAVLGRDFTYALLSAVAAVADRSATLCERGDSEFALRSALDRLAEADLVIAEDAAAQTTYRFRHVLIQEAAYASLLKSRRQALHRSAAKALVAAPDMLPELVAHHFTQAGQTELAIEWWGKAGDAALQRSAFREAISHLGKAIAMSDKVESADSRRAAGDETRSSQRLKLQSDYGQAVMWSKGFAAEETRAAFVRATELATGTESAPERYSLYFGHERYALYFGQWTMHLVRGELRDAEEIATRFLLDAETAVQGSEAATARYALGATCLFQGKLSDAKSNLERVLADWSRVPGGVPRVEDRADPGVAAAVYLALLVWQMGDPGRARQLSERAVQRAAELTHVQTTVITYV